MFGYCKQLLNTKALKYSLMEMPGRLLKISMSLYITNRNGNLNQNSPVKTKWVLLPSGMPVPVPVRVKNLEN